MARSRRPRDTSEIAAAIGRQIRALGKRISMEDPADLHMLGDLRRELDEQTRIAVDGIRKHGATDGDIAAALGVSRQAVSARWPLPGRVGAAGRYKHH